MPTGSQVMHAQSFFSSVLTILFLLTSGRKSRALGAARMHHRCRLRSETGWAEFGYFLCYSKMVALRVSLFPIAGQGEQRPWEQDCISQAQYSKSHTLRQIYPDPAENRCADLTWSLFHCKTTRGNEENN